MAQIPLSIPLSSENDDHPSSPSPSTSSSSSPSPSPARLGVNTPPLGGRGFQRMTRSSSFFSKQIPSLSSSSSSSGMDSPLSLNTLTKGLVGESITRVLVLYCGGTIGMKKDPIKGYLPIKNYLSSFLKSHERFHDEEYFQNIMAKTSSNFDIHTMDTSLGDVLVLPHFLDGAKRVAYQIHELADLKDSCNMVEKDYISLARTIEQHYHSYDGFLILHGTDTMAYTACALSFILEDLGKSVIITGSQVPFTELRNDAYENFLGSLILCSHYCIPEVTVYFSNFLYRGCRVKKINSEAFAAFNSPNMKPLGRLGVKIELDWGLIARSHSVRPFRASSALNSIVVCLRLYPGIQPSIITSITSPPVRGLILETYGSGNAPDNNPELLKALSDAVKRGVIIVNITQCTTGAAVAGYAAGYALSCTGVISGRDMTVECALMKLNYLLSHEDFTPDTIKRLMGESLRGELTAEDGIPTSDTLSGTPKQYLSLSGLVMEKSLLACPEAVRGPVEKLLRPVLLHNASACGNLDALQELLTRDFDINTTNHQGRTCLYEAISNNSVKTVDWLIRKGVNVHLRDNNGSTVLVYAVRHLIFTSDIKVTVECIRLLKTAGASLRNVCLTEQLLQFAHAGNCDVLKIIYECEGSLDCEDHTGKSILHIAVIHGHLHIIEWVARKKDLKFLFSKQDKLKQRPVDDAKYMLKYKGFGIDVTSLEKIISALEEGAKESTE